MHVSFLPCFLPQATEREAVDDGDRHDIFRQSNIHVHILYYTSVHAHEGIYSVKKWKERPSSSSYTTDACIFLRTSTKNVWMQYSALFFPKQKRKKDGWRLIRPCSFLSLHGVNHMYVMYICCLTSAVKSNTTSLCSSRRQSSCYCTSRITYCTCCSELLLTFRDAFFSEVDCSSVQTVAENSQAEFGVLLAVENVLEKNVRRKFVSRRRSKSTLTSSS